MRWFVSGLAALGILACAFLRAEVDRPRAEGEAPKKDEAEAGGKKLSADEHDAIHRKLAEESEENLKEIARLMEKVRGSLSQKQTGNATQSEQKEVVKRLQELIDKVGKG